MENTEPKTQDQTVIATAPDQPSHDPSRTADIANGTERQLDPRSIPHQRAAGAIAAACTVPWLLIGAGILARGPWLPIPLRIGLPSLLASLGVLMLWYTWFLPELSHRHASYRVDALGIQVRKGIWWRRAIFVPRSRIQHTDVSQGPIERNYGLASLHVFTAGTGNSEVALHGLAHADALRIRDHLITGDERDGV